jgi:glutamate/tyrosine decarboxylase-like PLP-dependent enzyme
LGDKIASSDIFNLLAPVRMNVVCFSVKRNNISMEQVRSFLNLVRDDGRTFFTPTLYNGVPGIRAAFSNWLTETNDVEIAWAALNEVFERGFN